MTESNVPPPPPPSDPNTPAPASVPYATPGASGYPGPYVGPAPDKDAKTMAMLCHLLSIFTGFLGPLVIWLMKKDSSPFVDDQGKEALNFWITVTVILFLCGVTSFLCIPAIIGLIVWVAGLIFAIMGTMQANNGVAYRYPINIRLIK